MLKAPGAENAAPSRCVSLIGGDSSVDLEAETNEQLSAFMFGLQGLLTSGGREVVVDENAEAAEAARLASQGHRSSGGGAGGAAPKQPARRFSILGSSLAGVEHSRHAHFKKAVLALPAEQSTQSMESGHTAAVFTFDHASHGGALVRNTQHVWFQSEGPGRFGLVCWSDSIKDRTVRADKSIDLKAVTDVYVGSFCSCDQAMLPLVA